MIKSLKTLLSDSLIYGISGILRSMIGIFLIPFYTRIFSPEEYGIISIITTTFFLIGLLAVCGLDNSAHRWYYDNEDLIDRKKTFSTWALFQLALSVLFSLLILLFSPIFSDLLLGSSEKSFLFIFPSLSLITGVLPAVVSNWYRVQRKPLATIVFTFFQTLVTVGCTILFVNVFQWGINGIFGALTVSSLIFTLIAIQQMRGWLSFKYFSQSRLFDMMKFSLPLIPAALSFWLLNNTDAYFISFFKNKTEVGLFAIGASLASVMSLFTGAFQQAWGPFAFSIINNVDARQIYAKVFLIYGYCIAFLAACFLMFAPEALMLFTTPEYFESAWVTGILSYNLMFIGFSYIAIIGISISKTTSPYAIAMLYATIVTIVLNILLIPAWGKEGSALATLVAQIIVPVYLFHKGQKNYFIPYEFKKVILIILVFAAIGLIARFIPFSCFIVQVLFKVLLALLMLVLIIQFNKSYLIVLYKKSIKKLY